MKIAIIGGGISGLAIYLNLQKQLARHPHLRADITIYESYVVQHGSNNVKSNIPSSGGGYGVAANAHIRGDETLAAGDMMFWWSRSTQKDPNSVPDNATLKRELQERLSSWKDPTIQEIIKASEITLKTPTWVLPELPTWTGKRVVLVGDAAHALPSSSGQGVSQALEDAEALSLLLTENLKIEISQACDLQALEKTFTQYMSVRKAHLDKVRDAGNKAGDTSRDMGHIAEILMYCAFWTILKFFGPFFAKHLTEYDVVTECEKVRRLERVETS